MMALSSIVDKAKGRLPPRPSIGRVASTAHLGLYAACAVLLAGVVGGAILFAYTVFETRHSLEVSATIEEARNALLHERFEEGRYDGTSIRELRLRTAETQASTREALRKLAITTDSTRGHIRINDETLPQHALHAAAVERLLANLGPGDIRGLGTQQSRVRNPALITDMDGSFLAVERSLSDASTEVLADATKRLSILRTLQILTLVIGPLICALALVSIVVLNEIMRTDQRRRLDRTERDAAEVCFNERRYRSLVMNATDLVLLCDASGRVAFASPSAESGWGYPAGTLSARSLVDLLDQSDRPAVAEFIAHATALPGTNTPPSAAIRIETAIIDPSGQWQDADLVLHNLMADPDVQAIVCIARDIGHRKERERALHGLALYDPVTGLPNSRLLHDRLDQALLRCRRRKAMVALVLVGSTPNPDAAVAGLALVERIARLRSALRATDTIARLHDDCLAIVLEDATDEPAIRRAAERLTAACGRQPDLHGGQCWDNQMAAPGLGVAFADAAEIDVDSLLQHAQLALDRAQPGGWFLFDADLRERTLDRIELAGDLRATDLKTEMHLLYQPMVQIDGRSLVGFEAVTVWNHPMQGPIEVGSLRSLAEEAGLVVPIGRWSIQDACRQLSVWQKQARFDPPLTIGVKVMAGHFQTPSLCADVVHALGSAGIRPGCLQLEIPAAAILHDVEATIARLWDLREIGVRVAVDGLGSGFSAVPILRQLPVDTLAIDVMTGGMDRQDSMEKACAMVALARSLQMQVAASGITTAEQEDLLASWGCDVGQGALYGEPMTNEEATQAVRTAARARAVRVSQGPRHPPRDPMAAEAAGQRPRPRPPLRGEWALDADARDPEPGRGPLRRPRSGSDAVRQDQDSGLRNV